MAFDYPDDLKYLDSHEYARLEGEIATIGITAFAVDQLGDIVFLELPEVSESCGRPQLSRDRYRCGSQFTVNRCTRATGR